MVVLGLSFIFDLRTADCQRQGGGNDFGNLHSQYEIPTGELWPGVNTTIMG